MVRRYFASLGLAALLRRELRGTLPRSDLGAVSMVLVVPALIVSGGRRLRHLLFIGDDPVVLRLCGLARIPTPRTPGRWLGAFRAHHLPALRWVNASVAARTIAKAGLRRLTIDVDGTVVSTGMQVQWAQRGFDPHHRKVPSNYPITAYEAQSGQILRTQHRAGELEVAVPAASPLVLQHRGDAPIEVEHQSQERLGHHRCVEAPVVRWDSTARIGRDPVTPRGRSEHRA